MLIETFYRVFWNMFFLLAVVVGLCLVIFGLADYTSPFDIFLIRELDPWYKAVEFNTYDATLWVMSQPYSIFAPLLAVLPFAASFAEDTQTSYVSHILVRTSLKKYFATKVLANMIAGGLALTIPVMFAFLFSFVFYYHGLPVRPQDIRISYTPGGPFDTLYRSAPLLYVLTLFLRAFVFGAAYASIGLLVSLFVKNRFVVLATPLVLYFLAEFVIEILDIFYGAKGLLHRWGTFSTIDPLMNPTSTFFTVYGELGGIIIVCMIGFLLLLRKERIYISFLDAAKYTLLAQEGSTR